MIFDLDPFTQLTIGIAVLYTVGLVGSVVKISLKRSNSFPVKKKKLRLLAWGSVGLTLFGLYLTWDGMVLALALMDVLGLLLLVPVIVGLLFKAYYSSATPMVSALWLRRFHIEPNASFRLSRVFEKLSVSNVRVLTLADSTVAASSLSRRQVYIKLILEFIVLLVLPVTLAIMSSLLFFNVMINWELISRKIDFADWVFAECLADYPCFIVVASGFFGLMLLVGVVNFVLNFRNVRTRGSGAVELDNAAIATRLENEARRVRALAGADYYSGNRVFRVDDENWKHAVSSAIDAVDLVFFDVSEFSESMQWEMEQLLSRKQRPLIVLLSESGKIDPQYQALFASHSLDPLPPVLAYGEHSEKGRKGEKSFLKTIMSTVSELAETGPRVAASVA